ncbi:AT-rich interactive domain-containing protein 3A [Galemys pyrenaicus]|uniref:AT-rich interactive domain-containing protein 3 n=1 Tax=Galemys pyrenaicus TaxID=202257 RepID=A0A8J6AHS1_GALPY|nr:AT-rich interactive domain-containing protein 3A [Galemys pyrenaicus]
MPLSQPGPACELAPPTCQSRQAPGDSASAAAKLLCRRGRPLRCFVSHLYELDGDPKRKEFLDDLFSFMQKRGTPVNRIPIMAKQVLDLFMLYVLVTEKGGLVEVINKKLWREITKGLNLPTSITSAAFTLRTQYMKYLYPYECEKRGLSNPNELQAAIDSNRREGRRQSFGGSLFAYSPGGAHGVLSSPKLPMPSLGLAASTNGGAITPAPKIKKEEESAIPITVPSHLPVSLAGHPVVAAQAAAVQAAAAQAAVAAQAAALEQLREKLESGEPPEKKLALVADEQQRLMQRALQQNLLAMTAQLPMSIRINSQASESRQDSTASLTGANGGSSISMSVEINGIVYTGGARGVPAGSLGAAPALLAAGAQAGGAGARGLPVSGQRQDREPSVLWRETGLAELGVRLSWAQKRAGRHASPVAVEAPGLRRTRSRAAARTGLCVLPRGAAAPGAELPGGPAGRTQGRPGSPGRRRAVAGPVT